MIKKKEPVRYTKEVLMLTVLLIIFSVTMVSAYAIYDFYHSYQITVKPFVYNFQPYNFIVTNATIGERELPNAFQFRTHDTPLSIKFKLDNVTQLKDVFADFTLTTQVMQGEKELYVISLTLDKPLDEVYLRDINTVYIVNLKFSYEVLTTPTVDEVNISLIFEAVEGVK